MKKLNLFFSLNRYDGTKKINEQIFPLQLNSLSQDISVKSLKEDKKSGTICVQFEVISKKIKNASISIIFEDKKHNSKNYIFSPAALYNGNRFRSSKSKYPPKYTKGEAQCGEPIVTDVPRLNLNGDSCVQLSTGDMATPCVGFFDKNDKSGHLIFWNQKNEFGDYGLTVTEKSLEKATRFIITSPCVREKTKYGMCTTEKKSDDKPANFNRGDLIVFNFQKFDFVCESINDFFEKFFNFRTAINLPNVIKNTVPWSYAYSLLENKYNHKNWVEKQKFYKSSEADSGICCQWQTGWVGGGINTFPGIVLGNEESQIKSRQTLDFIFNTIQHKSGFLYGIYCDGKVYGDDGNDTNNANIAMSRKNADALYFLSKQIKLLKNGNYECKELWINGTKKLADAFLNYFKINGDLGQFININDFKPFVSGTASASIAPAALVLCSEIYNNSEYLNAASKIAENYYNNFLIKGYTNGGPGEILGCPDSESAFGLLESFVCLYEHTGEKKWLNYSENAAALCSSWCVSYNYSYQKNTQFYHRGISTVGAVWASIQNKHAAPGICTLSGSSLLRLFRATGNLKYLDLCRDISHSITQFISTPDNPIYLSYVWNKKADIQKKLNTFYIKIILSIIKQKKEYGRNLNMKLPIVINAFGRIGERVNLSDWEGKENVGEVPGGSCWCEVSAMLTYLEIPSVYINPDIKFCYVLDHVECNFKASENGKKSIIICNPTSHDANYRLLIENSDNRKNVLDDMYMSKLLNVNLPANTEKSINL